jgi:hypothetical protein
MDTELSYPVSVKDSFLTCSGYSRDASDQNSVTGAGYEKRKNAFKLSRTVQLMHKIDADLFNQDLYLINNVEIDIEITPNESDFMVITPQILNIPAVPAVPATGTQQAQAAVPARQEANTRQYVLEIQNCRLFVKTVDLMDGLSLDIARKLDTHPARYGLRKTMLKSLFISQGTTEYTSALFTDEVC